MVINTNKHLFFDMDGTICPSRQKISKEMKEQLSKLGNIFVISGASREQMEYQLDGLSCTILAQSGNHTPLWENRLTKKEAEEVYKHANKIISVNPNMIEHRGCQIAFSLTGHNAPLEIKGKYDPDRKKRKAILKKYPFKSKTLICRIAGTTCLDYTRKDGTKGKNLQKWIKQNKFKKKDCIYFGDALFKGGNDETVIGVMKTIKVDSPESLLLKLKD